MNPATITRLDLALAAPGIFLLTAACIVIRARMRGSRVESRVAVAPGTISAATTRMAPTDSKALTITTASQAIRRK